jgi:hypothetical protein
MGGTGNDWGNALALDGSDNVLLTGFFNGTADFDPGAGTANLTSSGNTDIFLAKYGIEIITQLEEQLKQQKLTIYPNPANSIINIGGANTQNLEIQNTLGEIVFYKQNCNTLETIDVSGFASGVYFVRINEHTLKMVKE